MATATGGYSAGRVTLQVVPSYRNFMRLLRQDSPKLARAVAQDLEKSFEKHGFKAGQGMGEAVQRGMRKSSRGASGGIGDAFAKEVDQGLDRAIRALKKGNSDLEREFTALRRRFRGGGVDAKDMARQVDELGVRLARLARTTRDDRLKVQYDQASKALLGQARATQIARQEQQRLQTAEKATAAASRDGMRAVTRKNRALRDTARDSDNAQGSLLRLRNAISGARNDSQDGANAFRFFNFAVLGLAALGPALIPMLAALAGGIALLGTTLLGVGAGFGVAALGLSGISEAVKQLGESQKATSGSSEAMRRQQISSARSIADARRGLQDAYRSTAESMRNALRSQEDAERRLTDAQRSSREAQLELTAARREARRELADLDNQIAQNQLDERQGVIDLFNAYNQYGAVMSDGGATNLEREQADIGLKQAQLNLKRIREEQKRLADEKRKSDKDGLNGTDTMRRAQERLNRAIRDERDAREDVAEAARNVDRTREEGTRRVADAQRQLRRALEDASMASGGSAAQVDNLREAMDNLSPAGQRFARFIFGLKEGFDELRFIAQEGFLPGLQTGIEQILSTYAPGMRAWLKDTSELLGDLSEQAGITFTNPVWRSFFNQMAESSQVFIEDFGISMLNWMSGFASLAETSAPFAERFSGGLRSMSESFASWADSEKGRAAVERFLGFVERVGPKVLAFFGAFAGAMGNVGAALAPLGESVLVNLTAFFDYISTVDPAILRVINAGVLGLVVALQAAAGIMAVVSVAAAIGTAPLLILVGAVAALGAAFLFLSGTEGGIGGSFGRLVEAIRPVLDILIEVGTYLKDQLVRTWNESLAPAIEKIADKFTRDLMPALADFWELIKPIVFFIADVLWASIRGVIEGIGSIISGLITALSGVLNFVTGVFTGDWGKAWKGIKQIFSGVFEALWGVIKVVWNIGIVGGIRKGITLVGKLLGRIGGFFKRLFERPIGAAQTFALGFISRVLKGFQGLRDKVKTIFSKIGDFIKDGFRGGVKLALQGANVLIRGVNRIAGWVGLGKKNKAGNRELIPTINLKGFRSGGHTGRLPEHMIAGVTHGDEFVTRAPSRRKIEAKHPGLLDYMNRTGELPGYRNGGRVYPVAGSKRWTTYPGHTGIDFPRPTGTPVFAAESGRISAANRWGYSYGHHLRLSGRSGAQTIYAHLSQLLAKVGDIVNAGQLIGRVGSTGNSTGPHLHFESRPPGTDIGSAAYLNGAKVKPGGAGFTSVVGKVLDGLSERTQGFIKNPVGYLRGRVEDFFADKGSSGVLSLGAGAVEKLVGSVGDKLKKMIGDTLDVGKSFFTKATPVGLGLSLAGKVLGRGGAGNERPNLYDSGGWLPPGLSTVYNATGRPEPVFTGDQFERMLDGMGSRGDVWQLTATGADPVEVVNEFSRKISKQQRRIRRTAATTRRSR